jgi:F0F1-type ATP synthase assembly protein I
MLSTIPFLMVGPPIAGVLIGRFIDRKLETQPAFTIVFLALGFAAGVREVAIVLKRANARADDGETRDRDAPQSRGDDRDRR